MNFCKFFSYFSLALLLLFESCNGVKGLDSSQKQWKFDEDGWVLQKNSKAKKYDKIFAIGSWHLPGYTFSELKDSNNLSYEKNAALFKDRSDPFNMVFVAPSHRKEYMSDKIHIINPFSKVLHDYIDQIAGKSDKKDNDYYRSQLMKKVVNDPAFEEYLNKEIVKILKEISNDKYLFSHIDEIALGGVSKWAIPPSMGEKINTTLKSNDKNALVFVDLLGHAKGSTYLFEQRYLQNHDILPEDPPYDLIDKGALECNIPLLGFSQSYNGLPVYQFSDGKYYYNDFDEETLKSIWYENIKIIAKDYKNNGDVFGINAFNDFSALPILAGITVDALRDGLGKGVPIWLYFDGNGYSKPSKISPKSYVEMVKCQIYTAVIHGATGILFWNDWSKTPEVFDALLPMLKELNENLDIIYLPTIEKITDNDLNVMIKKDNKGEKYVIATNTSKTKELDLIVSGVPVKKLLPMEVYISDLEITKK